jgi:hypothetical protein
MCAYLISGIKIMFEYLILCIVIVLFFDWIVGCIKRSKKFSYYFKYFFSNKQDVESAESPKSQRIIIKADGNYEVKAYDYSEVKVNENAEIYL